MIVSDQTLYAFLNAEDKFKISEIALTRMNTSVRLGLEDKYGAVRNLSLDAIGAAGELAFAKIFDISYDRVGKINTFKLSDVEGSHIQIRSTDRRNGSLIVRQADSSDDFYVLMIIENEKVSCIGWIIGTEAKNSKFISAPNGRSAAFFVPQEELYFPIQLKTYLEVGC